MTGSVFEPLFQAHSHLVARLLRDGLADIGLDGQFVGAIAGLLMLDDARAQGNEGLAELLA